MNQKRRICLILALCMVLSMMLTACQPNSNTTTGAGGTTTAPAPTGKAKYQVKVLSPMGEPFVNGVAVIFKQNDGSQVMQTMDANGVATKELDRSDYTVELFFTDKKAIYDYAGADVTLTANKTELTIQVYNGIRENKFTTLNVKLDDSNNTHNREAYDVVEGMTRVKLIPGERNFFIFTPERGGQYEIKVESNVEKVGYYGATHFVSHISAPHETKDDHTFINDVKNTDIGSTTGVGGTAQLVYGIDAGEATSTVLTITRVGDPIPGLPYEGYPTTTVLTKYEHPAGAQIKNFIVENPDASYTLVYNEADGYYHLNSADGPLVLMRVGKAADGDSCPYMSSLETMVSQEALIQIVYDENGEALKGINFSQCIRDHAQYADTNTGLFPLTKELEHILKVMGQIKGWWNPVPFETGEDNYLFYYSNGTKNVEISQEFAWLFNCCYIAN